MRNSMKVEMEVLGGMIGANSTAAVSFNDREAAGDLLQGLSAQPAIRIGRIHLPNGEVFAEYRRLDVPEETAADPGEHRTAFEGGRLVLHRSIALDGQPIGSIYLESDLRDLENGGPTPPSSHWQCWLYPASPRFSWPAASSASSPIP